MRIVPFKQVDVFTGTPFRGNPVAVVLDAEGLEPAEMQRIANWTNLSETTFVLPPTDARADYRLRIFTPRRELPFAGHPSVGTAHAVLESGWVRPHVAKMVQECAAGLLPITIQGEGAERLIMVRAPEARLEEADMMLSVALAKALGATIDVEPAPRAINVGPTWLIVDLQEAERVRKLKPDMTKLAEVNRDFGGVGVTVFGRSGDALTPIVVRSFCPGDSILEDPVCGSGNAAVAAFLRDNDLIDPGEVRYVASQGREVGRDGLVHVRVTADGDIEVGGRAVTVIDGGVRV